MTFPSTLRRIPPNPLALARPAGALLLAALGVARVAGAQLSNDTICGALSVGPGTGTYTNVGALVPAVGGCVTINSDVWFVFDPTASELGYWTISTCGPSGTLADTVLEVFEGPDCASALLSPVACNDNSCGQRSSVTVFVPSTFNNYYIRVADAGGLLSSDQGTFPLSIGPPNDECVGAVLIAPTTGALAGNNFFASNSGSVSAFCNLSYNSDVWYQWVAPANESVTFTTCFANPGDIDDTVLQVLSGTCASLVGLGQNCNDNACGLRSAVTVPVTAGTTYYIRVAAAGSTTTWGGFFLFIESCSGAITSIPTGCGSPTFTPTLDANGCAEIGSTLYFDLSPPGPATFPLIWIGAPTAIPLCAPQACTLGATLDFVFPFNSLDVPIPNNPVLVGVVVAVQGGVLFSSFGCPASAYGIAFRVSNTLQVTIG